VKIRAIFTGADFNMTSLTLEMSIRTISRKYLSKVKCSIDHAHSVAGPGAKDSTVEETRKHVDKLGKEIVGKIRMELKLQMLIR
jgi:hypothetical protein